MRIGFIGGVPPVLGGGGRELQMERTAAALRRRGHEVVHVAAEPAGARIDVLHGFGAELQLFELLPHWRRSRCPLVVTPVTVVTSRQAHLLAVGARVKGAMTSARMRAVVLGQADAIVACTASERDVLVRALGAKTGRTIVIGNGIDLATGELPPLPAPVGQEPFVLMVGAVSERKRQREVLEALAGVARTVVVGGFEGSADERRGWDELVERTGTVWLDHVDDPATVRALQAAARCLVLLSSAEGESLAVLEALSVGTPVAISDLTQHRELRARYPNHVHLVQDMDGLRRAVAAVSDAPPHGRPPVPTWDDVAAKLERVYAQVGAT